MSSPHGWPEDVPVAGMRKCLDSVRLCWLMEYIPGGLHPSMASSLSRGQVGAVAACVQGIMQTLCLSLSATKAHRENGGLGGVKHQGPRETPLGKKGRKEATGFLLSSH